MPFSGESRDVTVIAKPFTVRCPDAEIIRSGFIEVLYYIAVTLGLLSRMEDLDTQPVFQCRAVFIRDLDGGDR